MLKVASDKIAAINARGAETLRTAVSHIERLEGEVEGLQAKIASMELDARVTLLAKEMEEKGLNSGLSFEEKVAHIRTKNLDTVQEAVKMASADGISIAQVTDQPGRGTLDSLTALCLGQE